MTGRALQEGGTPGRSAEYHPATMSTATTSEAQVVNRYFEDILNEGDLSAIDEIFAPSFQFHITTIPVPVRGREGERAFVQGLRTGFPDLEFKVETMIEEDNRVATRWSLSGTHEGDFLGIPATGNKVTDFGHDIFHLAGGKIREIWVNEDSLGLMRQLGVVPTPAGQPAAPPAPEVLPFMPRERGSVAENKTIIHRYFREIMTHGSEAAIEDLISPDFLFTIPTHGPARGPEGEKEEVRMLHTAFPDLQFTAPDVIADEEWVCARWVAYGTHLGPFLGAPPSGRRFWLEGIGSYHIVDGQLVQNIVNEDSLNLLIQLGVLPPPMSAPAG